MVVILIYLLSSEHFLPQLLFRIFRIQHCNVFRLSVISLHREGEGVTVSISQQPLYTYVMIKLR